MKTDQPPLTLIIPSDSRMLSVARAFVEAACQIGTLEKPLTHAVVMAAGEAFTNIVRHALAPTEETTGWTGARAAVAADLDAALAGVSIIAAPNLDLEARALALAARQALAEGRTVGIVSRDQTLARRIAAELKRHGIELHLPELPPGRHASGLPMTPGSRLRQATGLQP